MNFGFNAFGEAGFGEIYEPNPLQIHIAGGVIIRQNLRFSAGAIIRSGQYHFSAGARIHADFPLHFTAGAEIYQFLPLHISSKAIIRGGSGLVIDIKKGERIVF